MDKFFLFIVVFFALEETSMGTNEIKPEYKNYTNYMDTTRNVQDDMDGIAALTNSFEQLKGYNGDPCGSLTLWPWLLCTGYPPRVTFLYLSGFGLSGSLPDFSQMNALEYIYLSYNNLDGPIPDFLGKLPKLVYLDLSYNKFSGKLPRSITSNKNILYYSVAGNPDLDFSLAKKKNTALIIGLAVGIPLAIIIKVLVVAFILYSRQQKRQAALSQGQAFAFVPGGRTQPLSNIDISSVSMSTEPTSRPSHSMEHLSAANNVGVNIPSAPTFYGSTNQHNAVNSNGQNIDDKELGELLRQRSEHGGS